MMTKKINLTRDEIKHILIRCSTAEVNELFVVTRMVDIERAKRNIEVYVKAIDRVVYEQPLSCLQSQLNGTLGWRVRVIENN